jgi:cadmium resistance transport/sequestration family protein
METILASTVAFITTNIDDIFILMLFFSDPKRKNVTVILGQYVGISTLIAISFIGSFIGLIIDLKYVGLLGLIPIYIGIKSMRSLFNRNSPKDEEREIMLRADQSGNQMQQVLSVTAITIANGGDNISIYVPLYATLTSSGKATMTTVFLLMTAVWCLLAIYLSNHPMIKKSVEKYGHIFTPIVFILLGIYILVESQTFDLFFRD